MPFLFENKETLKEVETTVEEKVFVTNFVKKILNDVIKKMVDSKEKEIVVHNLETNSESSLEVYKLEEINIDVEEYNYIDNYFNKSENGDVISLASSIKSPNSSKDNSEDEWYQII